MQKLELWKETKFRVVKGRLRASKNPAELARSSRIVADLVADFYTGAIPKWSRGDLADLGCGKAPLLGFYRSYCTSVTLVDWANSMHENPLLDLVIDLNQPLTQIASNSFDTILLSDVLEHISEPTKLLCEIFRILRPEGHIILNVPFMYQVHEIPHDYYRYTSFALERLVVQSGLSVIDTVPLGGWIELLGDLVSKVLAQSRLFIFVPPLHYAVMTLHRVPWGKRLAHRGRQVVPLGYGLIAQKPRDPSCSIID